MSKNLNISNLSLTIKFIKNIFKIAESARFSVNDKGTTVNSITQDGIGRIYFKTTTMKADEGEYFEFNFQDISKLAKTLNALSQVIDEEECVVKYTPQDLSFAGKMKFKLKLVKPDIIDRFYTKPIKSEIKDLWTINTSSKCVSKLLSNVDIVGDTELVKVYYTSSDDGKTALMEIDDKLNTYSNNFSLPMGNLDGIINQVVCSNIPACRIFTLIDSDDVKVSFTAKNVLKVISSSEIDDDEISMIAYVKLLKQ